MKVFCCYLKDTLSKKISLDADVFVSRKKKHVHIANIQYLSMGPLTDL